MIIFLYGWLLSLVAILLIDIPWLLYMGSRFYYPNLQGVISDNIRIIPIAIFYTIYSFAISYLIISPLHGKYLGDKVDFSLHFLFLQGVALGLAAYSAYNLTNYATIQSWPLRVIIVDTFWGSLMTGSVVLISFLVIKKTII